MRVNSTNVIPGFETIKRGEPKRSDVVTPQATATNREAGFTPSSELSALLATLRSLPDERADVMESVSAKIESGEYDQSDSAERTAQAFLEAV